MNRECVKFILYQMHKEDDVITLFPFYSNTYLLVLQDHPVIVKRSGTCHCELDLIGNLSGWRKVNPKSGRWRIVLTMFHRWISQNRRRP